MRLNRPSHLDFLADCEKRKSSPTLGAGAATSGADKLNAKAKSKKDAKSDKARRSYISLASSVTNAEDEGDAPLLPIPLVRTKLVEV